MIQVHLNEVREFSHQHQKLKQRLSRLQKIKSDADSEIIKLKELRNTLVQKNLDGIYPDDIFKEQNTVVEEKITKAQIAKDDTTLDKYNIDAVTNFLKTLLADLGEAFKRSNPTKIKILLGPMFPSGLAWNYDGHFLNHQLISIYQYIIDFEKGFISYGAGNESYFEPLLAHFNKLMELYLAAGEEEHDR